PGMAINSKDGDFKKFTFSDRDVVTPFHSDCSIGSDGLPDDDSIVDGYSTGLKRGAKKVSVQVNGRDEPLYGVLMLCEVPLTAKGAASRIHLLEAPQKFVDEAKEGRV
ncbi:hypothetical protein ABMA58_19165, partial [Oceanospirillum sp. HFRX-1_2]